MNKTIHPAWTLLSMTLAALLCGCAVASLSEIQASFDSRIQARGDCSMAVAKGTTRSEVCRAGDSTLLDVARRAHSAKGASSDARTDIATLRLAANAGWESATPEGLEIADAASAEGVQRCDAVSEKQFGTPRDCALLRVAPGMVAHVRAVILIDRIERSNPLSEDDRRSLALVSDSYVANTFEFIERVRSTRLVGDTDLDPSVLAYLDQQRRAFYCTAAGLVALNRRAGDTQRMSALFTRRQMMQKVDRRLASVTCARIA
jgi:hypothetical protein